MDKLRAIRFFCRVVEAKSYAAAGSLLNVQPSVVSRVIAGLETDLDCRLFNRTTRRLALTQAGALYYERSRQLLLDLEEADTVARTGTMRPSGLLRVGYHPALRVLLLRRLGEYLAQNPGVDVEMQVANSPSTVLDDGLDILLRVGRLADSSLVAKSLGWASIVTCAAPSYLERHGRPRHPEELRQHRAIIPGRRDEHSFAHWTFIRGGEREAIGIPVGVVVRDGVGVTDALLGRAGVAQIYDIAAAHHIAAAELEPIIQDWSSGRHPIVAVLPGRKHIPAKVRSFISFVQGIVRSGLG
jgi:LysR family transcriptional regulator for bpeEF and oprC